MKVINSTGYHFFDLKEPEKTRDELLLSLEELPIKGTIVLASEGINFSISVEESFKDKFYKRLFHVLKIAPFETKESPSDHFPHKRFFIKLRPEIVTLRYPEVNPGCNPAPYIEPCELKQWLDDKKDFILLDTRKKFEFEIGSFETAVNLGGHYFEDFPGEVDTYLSEKKDQTLVTFCTGGIRCEKGAPMMQLKGFQKVYQLKGGILKYFEECGSAHWRGNCFVFDHRAAVTPSLEPAEQMICQSCEKPYSLQEVRSEIDGLRLLCLSCYSEWRALKDQGIRWPKREGC